MKKVEIQEYLQKRLKNREERTEVTQDRVLKELAKVAFHEAADYTDATLKYRYKRILGNSYGLWIATEINEHYDSDDSREPFIKVAMGRQAAALQPMILWNLNPCHPKHRIYEDYIDKYKEGFVGGYQYQHFTLADNLSISEERKQEIASQYDPGSVWYRSDILGQRIEAEGLIYRIFADDEERFTIDRKDVPKLKYIEVGADVGGTKSNHAFCANGYD